MKLNEFLDDIEQVNDDSFRVTDDNQANWALRKIKELQQEIENNTRLAEKEIDKIKHWETQQNSRLADNIAYFESLLDDYALRKREQDPSFKSLSLPNGRIGFRKQQPKWNYDEKTLLDYLKRTELHELIRTTQVPNKTEIRKVFEVVGDKVINKETGEVVEGIEIEQRPEAFSWSVTK